MDFETLLLNNTVVVSRAHVDNDVFLQEAVARYKVFLYLIKGNRERSIKLFCVPTYDIDLIWHTHQLHAHSYCNDLTKMIEKGIAKLIEAGQMPLAAVVIMACSRTDYLERTDGSDQAVKIKALSYNQLTYMQHLDFEPVITERPGELIAYYKIARKDWFLLSLRPSSSITETLFNTGHYKWALDQLFYKHKFGRVTI
ncbi:predicted protein [Arabidopsis lyrata subsp. lyrata]|uniref:Alpha-1,3-mannosyl-glycoprotein 2-beta-N-acetylglucosaminyltransferase n=1 Tax=Arabidopsis lyrata subsp. lyrata TaxID=81972 RepID=D7LY86_ARALL|nr:predicted protein [Arabidopsis lyrata subsp. lyrata]